MAVTYNIQNDTLTADGFVEQGTSSPRLTVSKTNIVTVAGQLIEDTSLSKQMVLSKEGNLTVKSLVEVIYGQVTTNWAARVVANGGAAPSDNTKLALNTFYNGLVAAGLDTKMVAVNCYAPDNLIAAITPFIRISGSDPWTNHSFVAGDLTINGLKGGSPKYLESGVTPSTTYGGSKNVGMTIYNMSSTYTSSRHDIGVSNLGTFQTSRLGAYGATTGQFTAFGGGESGGGYINSLRPSGSTGYYSGNRTAGNLLRLYVANSTTPHVIGGTAVLDYGSVPTSPYLVHAASIPSGGGISYSDKRLSFAAIHWGLTITESATLYALVQAMRQSLGGGYA